MDEGPLLQVIDEALYCQKIETASLCHCHFESHVSAPAYIETQPLFEMTDRQIVKMQDDDADGRSSAPGTGLATKTRPKTKKPSLYRVLLLNDDFTPMEFVVHVLERFFSKTQEQATQIMLHVHNNGVGECGVYTYEVAETKVTQVMDFAQKHQHPLQCVMEKK